jgi:hypothetical protein
MKSASIKGNCENLKHLIDTLNDKWCTPFQQKLEPSKSAVIHFVRGKKTTPEDEVKTALGTITSALTAKLPGSTIIFTDSKSNLKALENVSLTNPTILQVDPKILLILVS